YGYIVWANGSPIDWNSKGVLDTVVNLSSTEAEMYASNYGLLKATIANRIAWEMDFGIPLSHDSDVNVITLFIDNASAVKIIEKQDEFSLAIRHCDIRVKWVLNEKRHGRARACHVAGKLNAADLMTKVFARTRFLDLCDLVYLVRWEL